MLDKLREILGLLSGYKQRYDEVVAELEDIKKIMAEADRRIDVILAIVRSWNGHDRKA